jgi:ribosomal protein S16
VTLQQDRATHWVSVGAQPSEAVARLLKKANIINAEGKKVPQTTEAAPVAA